MRQNIRNFQLQELMDPTPKSELEEAEKEIEKEPKAGGPNWSPAEQTVDGIGEGLGELARGFTSPLALATLGMGALPRTAQKIISLAFAAQMVKQTPDLARQLKAEFAKAPEQRDNKKIARLITVGVGNLTSAGLAAKHGLEPTPTPKQEPELTKTDQQQKVKPDEPEENNPSTQGTPRQDGTSVAGAASFVGNDGDTIPSLRGDSGERQRQATSLQKWAGKTGRLSDYTPPAGAKPIQGGERDVFFDPETNRVYKRTYPPGTFGLIGVGGGLDEGATPYFYLHRLDLMNQVFNSGIRVEAVTPGEKCSVVTSEPAYKAADPLHPHPSDDEIAQFMRQHGFEPMSDFGDRGWVRKADGVMALDAFPKNFIKTSEGVVPVDLILQDGPQTLP